MTGVGWMVPAPFPFDTARAALRVRASGEA